MADCVESTPSERSPLLQPSRPAGPSRTASIIPQAHSPYFILFLASCAVFMLLFGDLLSVTPQLRIYEDIICRHYYDEIQGKGHIALSGDVDESLCKIDEIQEELAIIVGGLSVVEGIPSILFALPYGVLGDRIGRKYVFGLAVMGIAFSQIWILIVCWFWKIFPLRLIWLNPAFQIIGGGPAILQSTIYVIISDVSTDANRANHFFWFSCSAMVAEIISPSIASWLMVRSPWIPLIASLGIIILSSFSMIFVPETLHKKVLNGSTEPVAEASGSYPGLPPASTLLTKGSLYQKFKNDFVSTFETLRVYASPTLFILLSTFIIPMLCRQVIGLVLRYISKRFSWSLAQTGFLLSLRALIHILLFLAILPGISHILTTSKTAYSVPGFRFNFSTASKDLILARFSLIIQIVGVFLFALSALSSPVSESTQESRLPLALAIGGLIIYTFGMGFNTFCRSLISTLVDQEHVARLYAVLSIIDYVGASITGPSLAWLYSWGLRLSRKGQRNGYLGLPFWGTIVFTVLAGGGIMWVKAPERPHESFEEDDIRTAESELQSELVI